MEPAPDGQWWTLHHAAGPDRPAWYASFGARTPVEIIAAFTDALTAPTAGVADAWNLSTTQAGHRRSTTTGSPHPTARYASTGTRQPAPGG
ncbi:DUF317 domain-containing protein [Streptomyces sp. PBH53]|uniref:DUF317 domain-containing protein n=1 Tax=Streptomyces sp. PBH53 TaxID=1577075 RepID=UPI0028FC7BF9|nr:DUF317 domain-containing protein [Streptomyces sp. PBH53]